MLVTYREIGAKGQKFEPDRSVWLRGLVFGALMSDCAVGHRQAWQAADTYQYWRR